jgi:hypothetical protein
MLISNSFVLHHRWDGSGERTKQAFVALRQAGEVERQCVATHRDCVDSVARPYLAALLQESQRVWQLASREYTSSLRDHIAMLLPAPS